MMAQTNEFPCYCDRFLYFSYAAHMFKFYLDMNCPSAEFVSIARLENYRLDFYRYSHFWGGPMATLVPTANAHVWGVVWRIHDNDSSKLDEVKLLEFKKYYKKYLNVLTPHMGELNCRIYIQEMNPLPRGDNDTIPVEHWPSRSYKNIMIRGCVTNELPPYYIKCLRKLKNNDERGCLKMSMMLQRFDSQPPCECRVPGRVPRQPFKKNMRKLKVNFPQS